MVWLRGRGLDGVKLIVGDKCLGMLEAVGEVFPEAKYQRCTIRFYRIEETLTYCNFPGEHWYQQRDRAAEPRDLPQNPRGGDIP